MTRGITALAATALMFTTACTVAVPTPTSPSTPSPTTPDEQSATQPSAAPATLSASATPHEPLPSASPVAAKEATGEGVTVRAEAFPLRREPRATVVAMKLTVVGGRSTGFLKQLSSDVLSDQTPTSMRVIDSTTGVAHLPSTLDARAACGPQVLVEIEQGDVVWVSCVFGPLPASTTQVTVQLSPFGSFDAVPVR